MTVFRKKALKRISSPESLNDTIVAARPLHTVVFLVFFLLVAFTVFWGFFGQVPTRVAAQGILLRQDSQVFTAAAEGSGRLTELRVAIGDRVEAGTVIAILEQPLDLQQLDAARRQLALAEARLQETKRNREEDERGRQTLLKKQMAVIEKRLENAGSRERNLVELVDDLEGLFDRGFTTRQNFNERRNELLATRETIGDLQSELVGLEVAERERVERWRERIRSNEREIEDLSAEAEALKARIDKLKFVEAPVRGDVTEFSASIGDVVAQGAPVVRLVSEASEMDALLFVDPRDGRLIQVGMSANIELSIARREEFGSIVSDVRSVSKLPLSNSAMLAILHNEQLVQLFNQEGPPIAVRAKLREKTNADGEPIRDAFVWVGGRGPEFEIERGTIVNATITVRQQRPITLVIPFFRSLLGI